LEWCYSWSLRYSWSTLLLDFAPARLRAKSSRSDVLVGAKSTEDAPPAPACNQEGEQLTTTTQRMSTRKTKRGIECTGCTLEVFLSI